MPDTKKPETATINGKTFEVPHSTLVCKKCGTTNYHYSDYGPFYCDNCGEKFNLPQPPMDGGPDEWA